MKSESVIEIKKNKEMRVILKLMRGFWSSQKKKEGFLESGSCFIGVCSETGLLKEVMGVPIALPIV